MNHLRDISELIGSPINNDTFYIYHEIPEKYYHDLTPAEEEYLFESKNPGVKIVGTDYRIYVVAMVPSVKDSARRHSAWLCHKLAVVFGCYSVWGCWVWERTRS